MGFDIAECKQAERAGRQGIKFEKTIAKLLSRFVGVCDIDDAINHSLCDIGKLSGASHAYIFLLSEEDTVMDNTHEWSGEGVSSQIDSLKNLSCDSFKWLMPKLYKGEAIRIDNVTKLPAEAKNERELFESNNIKSVLMIPLKTNGKPIGFIGFDQVSKVKSWRDEDIALLCIVSDIFGSAFIRKQIKEALIASEEKYRNIFENTGTAMIVVDDDMMIYLANSEFEKLSGYSKEEIQSKKKWTEFFSQEDLGRMKEYHRLRRIDQSAAPRNYECSLINKYGNLKNIFITVSMVPRSRRSTGSLIEITQHKKAEESLRESKEWLRSIFNGSKDAIFISKSDAKFFDVNDAATSLTGYSKEELKNMSINDLHTPEGMHAFRNFFDRTMAGESVISAAKILKKDGTEVDTEFSNQRIIVRGIPYMHTVARDITERKKIEKALLSERERLYSLLDGLPAYVFLLTPDHSIFFTNQYFKKTFGEPTGEKCYKIIAGRDEPCEICKPARVFESKKQETWEWSNSFGRIYQVYAYPFRDIDGSPLVLELGIDITEVRQLEKQFRQAHKMEAMGALAGGIAHDFNNILSAIIGNTELAQLGLNNTTEAHQYIQNILKASNRAKDLVKQILAFSREAEFEKKPVIISSIIKEVIRLMKSVLPANIDIQQRIETNIKTVEADPTQIHQVLINLCINAAHAMEEHGGVVEVNLTNLDIGPENADSYPELNHGEYVKLSVRDKGLGMENAVRERIFDPYFTTKESHKGTGMGLSVVLGIVKSHGGAITVQSELGKGSTFNVYFPVIISEITEEPEASAPLPTGNERILFVDDNKALTKLCQEMLEYLGYEVVTRLDSLEALEEFQSKPYQFDLVITDLAMPHMTGDKLAEKIVGIRRDIPIILCTGYSEKIMEKKAKKIGIMEFIMKPVLLKDLAHAVRKVLNNE